MKIVLISGSSRANSQSLKVTKWLQKQLDNKHIETEVVDLQQIVLPIQHEEIWSEIDSLPAAVALRETLGSADGFVVVAPEWNGMVAPALRNLFVYVRHTMANKPAYLVGVSAYRGGTYPIAEMRMNSAKNSFVNYLPEHLVIRGAESFMNDNEASASDEDDAYIRARAIYGLNILEEYAKALKAVRDSGVFDYKTYTNGM